jgi:hypothetical protein
VTNVSIAKQRLGKQASTIERLFYGARTPAIAVQWFGKHATTIKTVFCMVRAEELS